MANLNKIKKDCNFGAHLARWPCDVT